MAFSTASAPTTPVESVSKQQFFEQLKNSQEDDIIWDSLGQTSPGSKRYPTFKDFADKIKKLKQENFQLKVRVFVAEQKSGIKYTPQEFEELITCCSQQLRNVLMPNDSTHSFYLPFEVDSLPQLNHLKSQNEALQTQVLDLQQKSCNYETALRDHKVENRSLMDENHELKEKLRIMETEVELINSKFQHLKEAQALHDDKEIEQGAQIIFGGLEDEVVKNELERKLQEETEKVHRLEKKLVRLKREYDKVIESNRRAEDKVVECSKTLVEFGKQNVELSTRIEELKLAQIQQKSDLNNSKTLDSSMQKRLVAIRDVVNLLQGRIKEIIRFMEAFLQLDSKKIIRIPGFKDENKESLRLSIEQCNTLSKNLDELFRLADDSLIMQRFEKCLRHSSKDVLDNTWTYNSHHYDPDRRDAGDRRPDVEVWKKCVEVQCNLDNYTETIAEMQQIILSLKMRLSESEFARAQMLEDHSKLTHQMQSLNEELDHSRETIDKLKQAHRIASSQSTTALEMENNALMERLSKSEKALRKLHLEHAKLVYQLKDMKTLQQSVSQEKLTASILELERPSENTSPDLGIDSGQDAATNSDDSNSVKFRNENQILKNANRELALKLQHAKQTLHKTVEKLHSTTKQKEQMEKAVCRQLHKTHSILRNAKKSVERFPSTSNQNILPTDVPPINN